MKHLGLIASIIIIFLFGLAIGKLGEPEKAAPIPQQKGETGVMEVGNWTHPPRLDLLVERNPVEGWDLQLIVSNMVFAPSRAGRGHVRGEGHAHLIVDGRERAILYGSWYHLPDLGPGSHHLLVTLNANSHEVYTVSGQKVEDTELVIEG